MGDRNFRVGLYGANFHMKIVNLFQILKKIKVFLGEKGVSLKNLHIEARGSWRYPKAPYMVYPALRYLKILIKVIKF